MNRTGKIICGAAFLLFGIGWLLEILNVINFNYEGWWTIFVIFPFLVGLFSYKDKTGSLIGLGTGVLLLLACRDIISWNDFWKLVICLVAIVVGIGILFSRKGFFSNNAPERETIKEIRNVNQDGRQIRQINVSFGKRIYEFAGQQFEGADVQASFGFVSLDLRNADILDGAVLNIECSFGGMEIRIGGDVCVKQALNTSFGGVEDNHAVMSANGTKTLYIKGRCNFGGIEIK